MSIRGSLPALLIEIYHRLRTHFGYRNWWPGNTPFEIVVGAILTQNTNWANVEKAIANLKAADALSPEAILAMPPERLCALIRSSGFFNQKSKRLRDITQWWWNFQSTYKTPNSEDIKSIRSELLEINGIGPETADCILLYALNLTTFVIDSYTRRAAARIGITKGEIPYEPLKKLFENHLPKDLDLYNDYHAQWVALGKNYCRKIPLCRDCPLRELCKYYLSPCEEG